MEEYHIEVKKFIEKSKYHDMTKQRYLRHLELFGLFLAEKTEDSYENIHLEKIYCIIGGNEEVIAYRPIDFALIDEYLFKMSTEKFHYLSMGRSSLGSFFKYLRKNYDFPNVIGQLEFNISDYRPEPSHQRILHRHEVIKLFQSIVTHSPSLSRDALLFTLLASTGCRITEILNLKVSEIDFTADSFLLKETKNKKQHVVVLRNGIGEILQKYCHQNKLSDNDYLFKGKNNKPITRNNVLTLLHKFCQKSNLPKVNIHSLRHSFATLMYESGSELTTIMQLLNHSNLTSTKNYVTPNYIRNYDLNIPEVKEVYKYLDTLKRNHLHHA